MKTSLLLPLLVSTFCFGAARAAAETSVRRYALIVGMNDGGKERVQLRYAEDDANAVSRVLEDLGGVAADDRQLLLGASRAKVESALQAFGEKLRDPRAKGTLHQLIFYYSGHSDEEGLLLGSERLPYGELRKLIAAAGADIQIAILDSCSSGALVRSKGGKVRPPFLVDESVTARGHVYLTSSSEDEVAQESDRIRGSFFTHFLISGLRGAADTTRDGRVTLNEAYQYAFDETLRRTEQTSGGAQHAAYDIQLAGTGDLVITDLRASSAGLALGPKLEGRFYLRDASGRLVAELYKARGRAAELALEPGVYQVTLQTQDALLSSTLTVEPAKRAELGEMVSVSPELADARGGALKPKEEPQLPDAPWSPFSLSVIPMLSTNGVSRMSTNFAVDIVWGAYRDVDGAQLSLAVAQAERNFDGWQASGGIALVGGRLTGAQMSSAVNWVGGPMEGVQMVGGVNWLSGSMLGAQLSGGVNVATGPMEGAQLTGGVNIASEPAVGAQLAPLNIAADIEGAQIGVLNIGGDVKGTQLGIINIASHFHGLRLGLFNFSQETRYHVSTWTSETEPFMVGFRMVDGPIYTLFSAGTRDLDFKGLTTTGFGLGVEIPFDPFYVDIDTSVYGIHDKWIESTNVLPIRTRAIFGLRLAEHFALFAGASATIGVPLDSNGAGLEAYAPSRRWGNKNGGVNVWPGFVAGLEI